MRHLPHAYSRFEHEPATRWTHEPPAAAPLETQSPRVEWLDAVRALGVCGVIVVHVTADPNGLPYAAHPYEDRVMPAMLRAIAMAASHPLFLVGSFFIMGLGVLRRERSYAEIIGPRLARVVPAFLFWTAAYLVIRNAKAFFFGYQAAYLAELADPASWVRYLLLGGAQYHLYFLPLLIGLTLLHPLFRPALRRPALGLLVMVTLLAWPTVDGYIYAGGHDPLTRSALLMASKIAAYIGYGLLAFALAGGLLARLSANARRGLAAGVGALAFVAMLQLLAQAHEVARTATWVSADLQTHLARYLLPAAVFVGLALAHIRRWPRALVWVGAHSFGIYLVHPAVLDALEIAERGLPLAPLTVVTFNFVAVVLLSMLIVRGIARVPSARWVVGLPRESRR